MKKILPVLLSLLLCAVILSAGADSLKDLQNEFMKAETLEQQMAILEQVAEENADLLQEGGWNMIWNRVPGAGMPDDLIPETLLPEDPDANEFQEKDCLPEELREHKFITFKLTGYSFPALLLYGNLLVRLPADMRASSLEEAEYAIIVECKNTASGFEYFIPATSYHRDYSAFVMDLKTGSVFLRFWSQRNSAKRSGRLDELDGDYFSEEELWEILRPRILGT